MRAKALLSLAGAFIAAVALVSASGAATTKAQKVTRINVSTRAAVVHYLRSIHVNPKGAVIQRGLRNYAGARCPGKHWACASTKHTVVQITGHGGMNRFACTRSHCVVVQISGVSHGVYVSGRQLAAKGGGGNSGSCVKTGSGATTGTGQSCTIVQSGSGTNTAAVYENSMKVSGLLAAAAYTASIQQTVTSGSNGNQACVLQTINLDGSTTGLKNKSVTVQLDGHQSVTIRQDVAGSGANEADQAAILNSGGTTASCPQSGSNTTGIAQNQIITSTVNGTGMITQNEDSASTLTIPCGGANSSRNLCIDIEQNQALNSTATGANSAVFNQTNQLVELAASPSGTPQINQNQGNLNADIGGLSGKVNQYSQGQSVFTATQNETQCEDAYRNQTLPTPTNPALCSTTPDGPLTNVAQTQYGPEGMGQPAKQNGRIRYTKVTKDSGDSSQTGNVGGPNPNHFTVTQTSTQNNDNDTTQNNHIAGGALTSGTGTVTQNAIIQNNHKEDVQIGTGTISGFITCTGSTKSSCQKSLSAPVINSAPNDPSFASDSADFTFSNSDPTVDFLCSLNGADYSACDGAGPGSGSQSYGPLAAGTYTFSVVTQDADRPLDISSPSTFTWTVLPLSVDALGGDGSAAGWACQPGGPIGLTLGTDTGNTFAEVDLTDVAGTALDTLPEPTFTTDNYAAGSPRYYITLDNGHSLWGYPPNSHLNGTDFAWAIDNGNTYTTWDAVRAAETGATVTGASVIADGDQAPGVTDKIGSLKFNNTTFNSGTCS